jgi:hypothetical protein
MFRSQGRMLEFFVTLLAFSAANAQSDKSLPGCQPPRELRVAMRDQLDPKKFEGMKTYERMAQRVEIETTVRTSARFWRNWPSNSSTASGSRTTASRR